MSKRRRKSDADAAQAAAPAAAAAAALAPAPPALVSGSDNRRSRDHPAATAAALRAKSPRRRGRGVASTDKAKRQRRRSREYRERTLCEAEQLLLQSAELKAREAELNAQIVQFMARSRVMRDRLRPAAAAAAAGAGSGAAAAAASDSEAGTPSAGCTDADTTDADGDADGIDGDDSSSADLVDQKRAKPVPAMGKHELLRRQRERVAATGGRARGKPLKDDEQNVYLRELAAAVDSGVSVETALTALHNRHGVGRDTMRKKWEAYHAAGGANDTSTAAPPCAAGTRVGRPKKLVSPEQAAHAVRLVDTAFNDGRTITYTEIYKEVKATTKESLLSAAVFRKRLKENHNLRFLRSGKVVPKVINTASHTAKRAEFVYQFSIALEEEARGDAVIVYMDETFIHQHHRRAGTIANMKDQKQFVERRRAAPAAAVQVSSRGRMYMLVHAMHEGGLLYGRNADGSRVQPKPHCPNTYANAEWLWMSDPKNTDSDYHNHISSSTIVQWAERRLFPAVRARFPNKKMYLVLDNSKNHCAMADDYVNPKSANKPTLIRIIDEYTRLEHIDVTRDKVQYRFRKADWNKRSNAKNPAKGGPSRDELADAVRRVYFVRPELCRTKLQEQFNVEVLRVACCRACCCKLIAVVHRGCSRSATIVSFSRTN